MFIMVCEMRGLSCTQIVEEIAINLHMKVSYGTVYSYIQKMEEMDKATFQELKNSSSSYYVSEAMKLKNHLSYYRKNIMRLITEKEFQHQLTPNMILRIHDFLMKIDQTEWNMIEAMPSLFGGVKSVSKSNVYGGPADTEANKDISQYISALEQHPIPNDLLELQSATEYDKLGTHMQEIPGAVARATIKKIQIIKIEFIVSIL